MAFALLAVACAPRPAAPPAEPPPAREPMAPVPPAPAGSPCRLVERVEVSKARHRLVAHCVGGARFETRVAFGRGGAGPKQLAGDGRTPEGTYYVAAAPRPSRFHRFVALDYPSVEDADRALAEGRITAADHERISAAHARGELPPGDTPLGGDFGLHGEGPRWQEISAQLDWTLGCLAVEDAAMDFLAERLPVGTPFVIRP